MGEENAVSNSLQLAMNCLYMQCWYTQYERVQQTTHRIVIGMRSGSGTWTYSGMSRDSRGSNNKNPYGQSQGSSRCSNNAQHSRTGSHGTYTNEYIPQRHQCGNDIWGYGIFDG